MNDVRKTLGPIDVFVNNAGYLSKGMIVDEGYLADWWKNMEVNVLGSFIAFRSFLPNAAKNAAILNTASGIGIMPSAPTMSAYQVSKLANSKLFENISAEHPDIFVLNVQPGVVASDLNRKSGMESIDNINLPGDFAVWVASPEARFHNGKYMFCNFDVEELVARKAEFEEPTFMRLGLDGWTAKGWSMIR
jgi:NAD(P)-dependent dehydrogenase (short-subunit alcohol dehydrogenase family)